MSAEIHKLAAFSRRRSLLYDVPIFSLEALGKCFLPLMEIEPRSFECLVRSVLTVPSDF
jgi:hypothetical protein